MSRGPSPAHHRFFLKTGHPPTSTLFPYTTLFRSVRQLRILSSSESKLTRTVFEPRSKVASRLLLLPGQLGAFLRALAARFDAARKRLDLGMLAGGLG